MSFAEKPEKTERPYRTKVVVVEDKSDGLIVPEARVRPGLLDPMKPVHDKAYPVGHRPKKVYTFCSVEKEIENPVEGSVIVSPSECKIMVQSRVCKSEGPVKTWGALTKYGLNVSLLQPSLVVQEEGFEIVTQVFRVNYADNAEWGCLVLRCLNESLFYGHDCYQQNELLTIYFYRGREDYEAAPYPPMLTLSRLQDQNYIPILPGQMLQIIPNLGATNIDDYQSNGDRCLFFNSTERLTKNGKFSVHRYDCLRTPLGHQSLFVNGETQSSVIIPPVHCCGKDVFVVVTEPYKSTRIDCSNITSLRVQFARNIPVMKFPTKYIEIPYANTAINELTVNFIRKLGTVTLLNEKGTCSINCTLPGFGTCYPPTKK